ncbi:MAG: putative lipid II flippase FtsW [Gammaproteobacteria bacterium]|nr:putative lipid II flippase FtsW [Gammaproteobacteria bacterium]
MIDRLLRRFVFDTASGARCPQLDCRLLLVAITLLTLGVVMVASASLAISERHVGQPWFYFSRQAVFAVLGLMVGAAVLRLRMSFWFKHDRAFLFIALGLLLLVLVPGIGREVNGSQRWMNMGLFSLQVSEPARLFLLVYLAGYLVRKEDEVRASLQGFIKPMAVLIMACALLIMEPDFGATVVLLAAVISMIFLAGVRLPFMGALLMLVGAVLTLLVIFSPYRMRRFMGFLDPWADPFDTGFQLTQSLIAIGRGEWFGVGLGGSIQKLFYLPEAHTDFVFAVYAEEMGLLGVLVLIALYAFIVWRAFSIALVARKAGDVFSCYLAYGIGVWIGVQSVINMGVNMGILPTKGLTLPLMSYGGSSLIVMSAAIAILLRIDYETRCCLDNMGSGSKKPSVRRRRRRT